MTHTNVDFHQSEQCTFSYKSSNYKDFQCEGCSLGLHTGLHKDLFSQSLTTGVPVPPPPPSLDSLLL